MAEPFSVETKHCRTQGHFRTYQDTYLLCVLVELKGPHNGRHCQKIFQNLEYLDWLKMHLPAWSKVLWPILY